jgi:tRNA(Ile)-lysidine synthase
LETVGRWKLFDSGDRLLAAVSGGIDSMALLHLTLHLPERIRPRVVVAHYNHRLRGKESDQDARFVEALCREWNVPFCSEEAPPWKEKSNLQARARELRYAFLKKTALESGIRKIVTAHQADDQAETFLIRWIQGAGLKGLAGIPFQRREGDFSFIRPLLLISREEIAEYARRREIPFREDSSNRREAYLRNRIRKLIESLKKENPNILGRAAANSLFLQADEALLGSLAEGVFQKSVEKEGERLTGSIRDYQNLPEALRFRLLQRMVQELVGGTFPSDAILKMDELLRNEAPLSRYDLPGGIGFTKDYVRFELAKKHRN